MEEVLHVPAWESAVRADLTYTVLVVLSKQLHANHSKDEDDDGQDEGQISKGTHRVANDFY